MTNLAIIGGTGLTSLESVDIISKKIHTTFYGETSAAIIRGTFADREICFLARHGNPPAIPPHKVNYRANIKALKGLGINRIIAVNAVGGITRKMLPCAIVLPDQIIDYTWSREHTFFDGNIDNLEHIDFTHPYSDTLRNTIIATAESIQLQTINSATYAATQGPRLETAAEIRKLKQDGCDIVGMTGMPEAALARELGIDYACIALVVNWAAGITDDIITMDIIQENLDNGMNKVRKLLQAVVAAL